MCLIDHSVTLLILTSYRYLWPGDVEGMGLLYIRSQVIWSNFLLFLLILYLHDNTNTNSQYKFSFLLLEYLYDRSHLTTQHRKLILRKRSLFRNINLGIKFDNIMYYVSCIMFVISCLFNLLHLKIILSCLIRRCILSKVELNFRVDGFRNCNKS